MAREQKQESQDAPAAGDKSTALTKNYNDVRGMLAKLAPHMAAVLPKHVTAEKMVKVALRATQKQPKLLDCDRQSMIAAMMDSAEVGLEPDGTHAALVPRMDSVKIGNVVKKQLRVHFQTMYKGILRLARNSDEIKDVEVRTVYKGDVFEYHYGLEPKLVHIPKEQSADPTHCYCIIRLKDGGTQWKVMSWDEIMKVKARFSKAGDSGPWGDPLTKIPMGEKTVFLRTAKWAPVSTELQKAVEQDEREDAGVETPLDPGILADVLGEQPTTLAQLTDKLEEAREPAEEKPEPKNEAAATTAATAPTPDGSELLAKKIVAEKIASAGEPQQQSLGDI